MSGRDSSSAFSMNYRNRIHGGSAKDAASLMTTGYTSSEIENALKQNEREIEESVNRLVTKRKCRFQTQINNEPRIHRRCAHLCQVAVGESPERPPVIWTWDCCLSSLGRGRHKDRRNTSTRHGRRPETFKQLLNAM